MQSNMNLHRRLSFERIFHEVVEVFRLFAMQKFVRMRRALRLEELILESAVGSHGARKRGQDLEMSRPLLECSSDKNHAVDGATIRGFEPEAIA